MNAYYILYPRDFANEYTVYVVTPENAGRFARLFPDAERITRKVAVERGLIRPREAKRSGEHWEGKFCGVSLYRSIEDAISECAARTAEELGHAEYEKANA